MHHIFVKNVSFLASLVAIALFGGGAAAEAETINTANKDDSALSSISQMSLEVTETNKGSAEIASATQSEVGSVEAPVIDSLVSSSQVSSGNDTQSSFPEVSAALEDSTQQLNSPTPEAASATSSPIPGTTTTSAAPLTTAPPAPQQAPAETDAEEVAQVDVDPGTPTFGGDSYIGVAGNLGLGGDSALGDSSFMVISKIGLTTRIAVRPSVAIEDNPVVLVPVTFDFSIRPVDAFTERLPIAPYVGGGVAFSTGDDSDIGPLITAGVDFPVTSRFTATAAVNAAFLDDTDVGILVGIGYNFSALGI